MMTVNPCSLPSWMEQSRLVPCLYKRSVSFTRSIMSWLNTGWRVRGHLNYSLPRTKPITSGSGESRTVARLPKMAYMRRWSTMPRGKSIHRVLAPRLQHTTHGTLSQAQHRRSCCAYQPTAKTHHLQMLRNYSQRALRKQMPFTVPFAWLQLKMHAQYSDRHSL